ncbi:MAG: hypothetical protein U0235_17890 [Polyangiaceae bacterium]
MLLLFVAVRRRLGTTAVERIAGSAARTIAASVAAAVAGFAVVGLARAALSGVGSRAPRADAAMVCRASRVAPRSRSRS